MDRARFEQLAAEAFDLLPDHAVEALDRVVIIVEEESEDGQRLGEYSGVPRTERSQDDVEVLPDRIILYQTTIEEESGVDEERIREEIRRTLWHEIAHHLGWDEKSLDEAETKRGWRQDEEEPEEVL